MKSWIKGGSIAAIGLAYAAGFLVRAGAATVDEFGTGPAEVATIYCTGVGTVGVPAGILKLNVDGVIVAGFCIDPFHFSDGSMSGYQVVSLTSAPKDNLMNATTALEVERLWASYYSPAMSAVNAAGLQIAIWELTGGSGFKLVSKNDYGAAGFLNVVEDPGYSGPVADLVALTGSGQDYAIQNDSINGPVESVPDVSSTLGLLALSLFGLIGAAQRIPRLATNRA